LADYNANIKVSADTKRAESELTKLQKTLNNLSDFSLKLNSKDIGRQVTQVGQQLRGIGERGAVGAVTLAAGKATTALSVLGAKFGVVGAAAAAAAGTINSTLGGVPGVITSILDQLGHIPSAFGLAAVAAMAFAPQLTKAAAGAVGLGAAVDKAVGGGVTQKFAALADGVGQLNMELNAVKATFADLLDGSTLNQLNDQLRDAVEQSGAFHSSTLEAVTAAEQLVETQRQQVREQKAINDLVRKAQGLQPQDVRDTEVARRVSQLKSRELQQQADLRLQGQINAELADYERLAAKAAAQTKSWADSLDRVARASRSGVLGNTNQLSARVEEFRRNRQSAEIARQRSAEALALESRQTGANYGLNQVPARGELFPGGNSVTASPQYRSMLNAQATTRAAATDAIAKSERTILGFQAQTLRTETSITAAKRQQQAIDERSIAAARERNALLLKQYAAEQRVANGQLDRRSRVADLRNQKSRGKDLAQRTESIALGVGFPLLFGGGVGTVAGSALGSLPMFGSGFGGQILGGAIGQIADQFAAAAADMGSALRDPITNFQKIADAGLLASKSQEFYVQKLVEVGRVTEAAAVVQAEIIKKVGATGVNDLQRLGAASDKLNKAWAELNLQMQAAIAGPLATLLEWVTSVVKLVGGRNAGIANTESIAKGLNPKDREQFLKELYKNAEGVNAFSSNLEARRAKQQEIQNRFAAKSNQPSVKSVLSAEALDQARKAAEAQADTIKSAYREGFQLQQQAHDLQRQGLDLQRRVADDIFNKQQQVFRTQIETERQRRQIAIETVDLEYRRRISNEEGRVAQVLEAEAALMRTKAQGEADLEARRRNTELDIAKQQRDTQNYVYQLNRDIDAIRRATLSFEMDVADYRLKIERQVQDQRRLDEAVPTAVGTSANTPSPIFSFKNTAAGGNIPTSIPKEQLRAWLIKQGFGRTSGDFTNRGHQTPNHILNAMDMGILGGSDAEALRRTSDMERKLAATGAFGNQLFGPIRDPYGHGAGKGGQNIHLHIPTPGGQVKMNAALWSLMQGSSSGIAPQLATAASAVRRPNIPGVPSSNIAGQASALDQRDAALKREQLTLQQQLNKLGEEAANQRVLEAARGPKDLQQRREAVSLAKAELAAIVPGSRVLQERLALEAQGLVKLQQRKEEDQRILETTTRTGAALKELVDAQAQGLANTQQQITLDREALRLTQEKQYAVERASLQSQLGVIGTGGAAGFTGGAASAYENALLQFGDPTKANEIATLTQQIDMARMATDAWHGSLQAVGSALGEAMTTGVASLINGTQSAQQVFAQFLQAVGQALSSAASQMIATYIAIGIAKLFAGLGSAGGAGGAPSVENLNAGAAQYGTGASFTMGDFGGFRAAGGPVASSSAYIVGERGPELFVPGTGGSVVPTSDLRSAMGSASGTSTTPVLNMSFQSTNIGGVEYVSRDQLEAAMAATRREASRDGAKRGMSMTLDKLQQSPGTRNRVGLR
jgi:hypothetical protein